MKGFEHSSPVHTKQEEFENRGITLRTHQMMFVRTKPEECVGSVFNKQQKFAVRVVHINCQRYSIKFENKTAGT